MALDHSLVGVPGEPPERSWTSKDALLRGGRPAVAPAAAAAGAQPAGA